MKLCMMTKRLMWFDKKMKKENRKTILFLDNATSNPS